MTETERWVQQTAMLKTEDRQLTPNPDNKNDLASTPGQHFLSSTLTQPYFLPQGDEIVQKAPELSVDSIVAGVKTRRHAHNESTQQSNKRVRTTAPTSVSDNDDDVASAPSASAARVTLAPALPGRDLSVRASAVNNTTVSVERLWCMRCFRTGYLAFKNRRSGVNLMSVTPLVCAHSSFTRQRCDQCYDRRKICDQVSIISPFLQTVVYACLLTSSFSQLLEWQGIGTILCLFGHSWPGCCVSAFKTMHTLIPGKPPLLVQTWIHKSFFSQRRPVLKLQTNLCDSRVLLTLQRQLTVAIMEFPHPG